MLDYISNNLNTAQTVLFFCAGWAVGRLIINVISHMIINAGFLKPNYRGEEINCIFVYTGSLYMSGADG